VLVSRLSDIETRETPALSNNSSSAHLSGESVKYAVIHAIDIDS